MRSARTSRRPCLALLEFAGWQGNYAEQGPLLPFVRGLAESLGVPAPRLVVATHERWEPRTTARGHSFLLYPVASLTGADHQRLLARLAELHPSHVLLAGSVPPRLAESIGAALGDAELREAPRPSRSAKGAANSGEDWIRSDWLLAWLGIRDPEAPRGLLVEVATPDHARVPVNEAAEHLEPVAWLVSGTACLYRRALHDSQEFAAVPLTDPDARGCAFCGGPKAWFSAPGTDPLALAGGQLEALRRTFPFDPGRRTTLVLHDARLFLRLEELVGLVCSTGLPPLMLRASARAAEVLAMARPLERVLPVLEASGHRLGFDAIGVENFSAEENRRLRKGTTPEQARRALGLMRDLGQRFAGAFGDGEHSAGAGREAACIVFTPWTRLADVRVNLEAGVELGFGRDLLWSYSCLRLHAGDAIADLAAHQGGILAPAFPDVGLELASRTTGHDAATLLPWRFLDATVAEFFRVYIRVATLPRRDGLTGQAFGDDPLVRRLREAVGPFLPPGWSPAEAGLRLLDELERRPECMLPDQVVEDTLRESLTLATARELPLAPPPACKVPPPTAKTRPREVRYLAQVARVVRVLTGGGSHAPWQPGPLALERDAQPPCLRVPLVRDGHRCELRICAPGAPGPAFYESPRLVAWLEGGGRAAGSVRRLLDALDARLAAHPGLPEP